MTTPMSAPQPEVEVSADAREALLAHLAADPVRNRFIRIHVGRG